jgi:HEAT repeat protein
MSDEMEAILKDLSNSDPELRESALDRIGVTKPDNAIELIVPFLGDSDAEVRGTAACNLGLIEDSRVIPYLIEVARRDTSEKVRAEAIVSLAEYRSPEILDCLIAEVHREKRSRRPRQEVAKQLRNYNTDDAVEALIELLQDDDAFVRDHAAESLLKAW